MSHNAPGWTYGYIPSAGEWNSWWAAKQDWTPSLDAVVNLNSGQIVGNAGSGVAGLSIGAGLSLTPSGTLVALDAVVESFSNDFTLVGGELELTTLGAAGNFNSGSVSATGRIVNYTSIAYLTTNQNITFSGDATGSGGTAVALTLASVIAGGTFGGTGSLVSSVTVNNKGLVTAAASRPSGGQITLQATASATLTVTPTLGVENFWINGPPSGGTVPIVIAPGSQAGQKIVVNFSQGATAANFTFATSGAGMNFGSALTPPTITATAGNRDNTVWILNDGTALWDFEAITQGFSP
jgi:hypothetical protein